MVVQSPTYHPKDCRHDVETRTAPFDDHGRRRYRRYRSGHTPETGGLHDQSDDCPEGARHPHVRGCSQGGHILGQDAERRLGCSDRRCRGSSRHFGRRSACQHRAGARLDGSRCRSLLRYGSVDRQGARHHRRLQGARHRPRPHPDQARLHLGRHQGSGSAADRGYRLQPDAALLQGPGHCLRRCQGLPDLAFRRAHPRLVQEVDRPRVHR